MNNFTIKLNPFDPYQLTYMGIGIDERGARQAVARQLSTDPDVVLLAASQWVVNYMLHDLKGPEDEAEARVCALGMTEILSSTPPVFIVDDGRNIVLSAKDETVIAAPSIVHGVRIAVCEVTGANALYHPSCNVVDQHGRHMAQRLNGAFQPI